MGWARKTALLPATILITYDPWSCVTVVTKGDPKLIPPLVAKGMFCTSYLYLIGHSLDENLRSASSVGSPL